MKIGIDCRMYSSKFTGIGRYVFELVDHVSKYDNDNEYVLFFNNPEYKTFNPPHTSIKKVLADVPIYSLQEQTKLLSLLNKEKLDLMHFTHFNAPLLYFRPSVVTIHDLTLSFYPGKKKHSWLHRLGYHVTLRSTVKKAKHVITISQNSKKDLMSLLRTPEKKITVIPQGVGEEFKPVTDTKRIKATLKKYDIKKPFLLYTGVWRSHKNIPTLVKAFHLLRKTFNIDDLRLVITGKDDPFYPEVRQTATSLHEDKHVLFPGLVSEQELLDLYTAATIYVFPSLYEGFGLPPLEAMACKTPVAASEVSSIPEVCGKGNAVYFDPKDSQDMAHKIYALLKNNSLQHDLVHKGLQRVKQFTWSSMAQSTLTVYSTCLNN